MNDFFRHGLDVDLRCGCGHQATLPYLDVITHFHRMQWGSGLDAAKRRFRCRECGGRPVQIGPSYR